VTRVVGIGTLAALVGLGFLLARPGVPHESSGPNQLGGCGDPDGLVIEVTPDSVGPFPRAGAVSVLHDRCPSAVDSVHYSPEGYPSPAVFLDPGGVRLIAIQHTDELDPERAADVWMLEASERILLPGGVTTRSTWHELQRSWGQPRGSTEMGPLAVWFCDHPDFTFWMDADPAPLGSPEVSLDLSGVPAGSRPVRVSASASPAPKAPRFLCNPAA
jgi:hypothetical protein